MAITNINRPPPSFGNHGRFGDRLKRGRLGQRLLAAWLRQERDTPSLPIGELPGSGDGGPRILLVDGRELTVPDLLTFPPRSPARLCEAKLKTAWSWYDGEPWTGVSEREFATYQQVGFAVGAPVEIAFLQQTGDADAPDGVFVANVHALSRSVRRNSGMCFWRPQEFAHEGSWSELINAALAEGVLSEDAP